MTPIHSYPVHALGGERLESKQATEIHVGWIITLDFRNIDDRGSVSVLSHHFSEESTRVVTISGSASERL